LSKDDGSFLNEITMTTINGELLDYTKRAIDDIYLSGDCCIYIHHHLYNIFREAFSNDEDVELMTMNNMNNWLLKKAPKLCNEYVKVVEYIMKYLKDNSVRYH